MFTICPPDPSEAPATASIHIASMSSNPLLPLQFPTPASLADLHEHLASDALDHLARRPPRILVARADGAGPESTSDPEASSPAATPGSSNGRGTVASFAKWTVVRPRRRRPLPRASPPSPPSPTRTSEPALGSRRLESGRAATEARQELDVGGSRQHHHHHEAEEEEEERGQQAESDDEREEWPASANREYLTAYDSAASTARREVMGSRPFLHLTFLCTDSRFRGRGVGTALMRAVTEVARAEGLPVFLESTTDAVPFYEKLGFVRTGGFRMSIPNGNPPNSKEGVYEEVCMILE
ncbi:GNAT family acetyltransferase [Colletotrichum tofieldiae]|uniref:GNAT family acetyltransferase n=1 Tax=Colletotrichum tofieldiae TaxID=708197 RepID=A0A166LQT9_9PEZI|nr:GNAT family acetyltransferase [Colletotrichum tofieldiae]